MNLASPEFLEMRCEWSPGNNRPSIDFGLSTRNPRILLPLGPQRTQLRSKYLTQQISISHGSWCLDLDTSLSITELSIV